MVRKGQSALEYMMTYGWAILVIVIVAAVLYSLGIFSPSSSVGTGSTGFAPFTASASNCTTSGLEIAFTVGGTPGGAPVEITGGSITSATGATDATGTVTVNPAATFVNSGSVVKVLFSGATCSTSGVHYSASVSITYSYTNSLGAQTGTTTGTVYGSAS